MHTHLATAVLERRRRSVAKKAKKAAKKTAKKATKKKGK
jgi:hypothetical protein